MDYIPISATLTFALITNDTQCVNILIINDAVVENNETFFLQAMDTNLTETSPQSVMITITNDDGICSQHDCVLQRYRYY